MRRAGGAQNYIERNDEGNDNLKRGALFFSTGEIEIKEKLAAIQGVLRYTVTR